MLENFQFNSLKKNSRKKYIGKYLRITLVLNAVKSLAIKSIRYIQCYANSSFSIHEFPFREWSVEALNIYYIFSESNLNCQMYCTNVTDIHHFESVVGATQEYCVPFRRFATWSPGGIPTLSRSLTEGPEKCVSFFFLVMNSAPQRLENMK